MATELGKAYVQIVPSANGISSGITSAMQPGAAAAGKSAGTTVSRSMGAQISAVGKNFVKAGAIATAISVPLIQGIKGALDAYEVQASAEAKLTEIYKTRMGATDAAAESTMKLASALQQEGIIGDEVALSGAQQLATFAKYPSTVNTLLPAMENLLAQQKGVNATEQDAVNIGNLMGKVMQGQTGALKRVGISFTSAQEQVLKYGTEEEKAAMLAEVINDNVGNMNKTLAKTPAGQMQQLKNSMGDLKEEVGAALAPVVAKLAQYVLDKIVPKLQQFVAWIQKHPMIAKITIGLTGLLAIGGPLLTMLGAVMMAVSALSAPFLAVVAAIAAAIAIGVLLYKNWDKIKAKAAALKEGIVNAFKKAGEGIKKIVSTWFKIITTPYRLAWNAIKKVIDKIKSAFKFKVKLPHIRLPHFSISPRGWKLGDLLKGVIPSLGIEWYAKGGIMTKPTMFGGGEDGAEGIIPLDPFWKQMDRIEARSGIDYDLLGKAVADALAESPVEVYMDGKKVSREISPSINRQLFNQSALDGRFA